MLMWPADAGATGMGLSYYSPIKEGGSGSVGLGLGAAYAFNRFIELPFSVTYYQLGGIPVSCAGDAPDGSICSSNRRAVGGSPWFRSHLLALELQARARTPMLARHELYAQAGGIALLPLSTTTYDGSVDRALASHLGSAAVTSDVKLGRRRHMPLGWQAGVGTQIYLGRRRHIYLETRFYTVRAAMTVKGTFKAAPNGGPPTERRARPLLAGLRMDFSGWMVKAGVGF